MTRFAMLDAVKTAVINTIYPPRCIACAGQTDAAHGLCATCWRETHFISGPACLKCGVPLVGDGGAGDCCETCATTPPSWDRGAAAVLYRGSARSVILGLKHGDRLDMVRPLAGWLRTAGAELLEAADLIAPVPLHWRRLLKRRYNQSAELARHLGALSHRRTVPDLLTRRRFTTPQEHMGPEERRKNQAGAFEVTRRHRALVTGKSIVLIDDVLTTGATLSSCADALREAGVIRVDVLALARVAMDEQVSILRQPHSQDTECP